MPLKLSTKHLSTAKRRILLGAGTFMVLWILFFDSHSVYSRFQMYRQEIQLKSENVELKEKIAVLEARLARPLTDAEIEKIARED